MTEDKRGAGNKGQEKGFLALRNGLDEKERLKEKGAKQWKGDERKKSGQETCVFAKQAFFLFPVFSINSPELYGNTTTINR